MNGAANWFMSCIMIGNDALNQLQQIFEFVINMDFMCWCGNQVGMHAKDSSDKPHSIFLLSLTLFFTLLGECFSRWLHIFFAAHTQNISFRFFFNFHCISVTSNCWFGSRSPPVMNSWSSKALLISPVFPLSFGWECTTSHMTKPYEFQCSMMYCSRLCNRRWTSGWIFRTMRVYAIGKRLWPTISAGIASLNEILEGFLIVSHGFSAPSNFYAARKWCSQQVLA